MLKCRNVFLVKYLVFVSQVQYYKSFLIGFGSILKIFLTMTRKSQVEISKCFLRKLVNQEIHYFFCRPSAIFWSFLIGIQRISASSMWFWISHTGRCQSSRSTRHYTMGSKPFMKQQGLSQHGCRGYLAPMDFQVLITNWHTMDQNNQERKETSESNV